MVAIMARYILGKNVLAAKVSSLDLVLPMDYFLIPQEFDSICKEYDRPLICLFVTRADTKLPLYDPVMWKEDIFQHWWDDLSICAFPQLLFYDRSC